MTTIDFVVVVMGVFTRSVNAGVTTDNVSL